MAKIVAMATAGVRSTVAAALYAEGHEVVLLHVDYGQPVAKAQRTALRAIAGSLADARLLTVSLPHVSEIDRYPDGLGEARSELARRSVAEGEGLSPLAFRGLWPLLWSTGVQCAARIGANIVCTGMSDAPTGDGVTPADEGDPAGRSRTFLHAYNIMLETATGRGRRVRLEAPLMDVGYADTIRLAARYRVPLEKTWSCSDSGKHPCGGCPSCRARMDAFADARLSDPLVDVVKV
jgi:7-cyano-7-deazaguanine synthase